jgi:hypothetical protein
MSETIILKKIPKIEFQFKDNGFELTNDKTEKNNGFFMYEEIESVELNKVWFPRLAKWIRVISWVLNGVPYFQDAKSYKKANIIIHLRDKNLGFWLDSPYMAQKAKQLKKIFAEKT